MGPNKSSLSGRLDPRKLPWQLFLIGKRHRSNAKSWQAPKEKFSLVALNCSEVREKGLPEETLQQVEAGWK